VDYLSESDQGVVVYAARRLEMAELTRDDVLEIETGRCRVERHYESSQYIACVVGLT
jgi:hypothetical protein